MPYRHGKCFLPEILRSLGLDPIDVYTRPTIKMSKQQFSDYYTGRSNMNATTLKMFSVELGVAMEVFYGWEYYPPPERKGKKHSTE